jgi:hypothetical protein
MPIQPKQVVYNTEVRLARQPKLEMVKNVPNPNLSFKTYKRYVKQYELVCNKKHGTRAWVEFFVEASDCVAVLVETPHHHNRQLLFPREMLDFVAPPNTTATPCTSSK